ncbi:response regulator [Dyella sp. KULCS107]|uniref:response regulator n=1 Tax=unclassified Dyella TaxID=2634549 RepID=UPI003D6E5FBB
MSGFDLFKRLLGSSGERRQHLPRTQAVRGARMLVVDDSPTIRAVLGKMLRQDGYAVSVAGDGESALALARSEKPQLIFLDIVMPGMNGFAVLRALRREPDTHGIPIVMISGNLQATEQFYVQRFGADDFMKKPFGRAEVFMRIQQLVEAGRLPARDPVLDPPQDLPTEPLETIDAIPDVALPDADDPHMVPPVITGPLLEPHDDAEPPLAKPATTDKPG